jgi:hypothetical protein
MLVAELSGFLHKIKEIKRVRSYHSYYHEEKKQTHSQGDRADYYRIA